MKSIRILILIVALVGILAAWQAGGTMAREPEALLSGPDSTRQHFQGIAPSLSSCGKSRGGEPVYEGTVFAVSKGDGVFFGGNHDYNNPDTFYWVEPGDDEDYGVIWIGAPGNVQQGVNEVGLAYDSNGLPEVGVNAHPERSPVTGGSNSYPMRILHECATVEEVIEWVQTHQWYPAMNDQKQFADASGDTVILSPGPNGELIFTLKSPGDGYLVSSNFNVTYPSHGYGYPCSRYETAQEMLGQLLDQESELTAQDAANVLDAVHQEGGTNWTVESLVADLPNGLIYLTYFHQFDEPVVLNVAEEIANPRPSGLLSELFPAGVRQEAADRYHRIQANADRCRWVGMLWVPGVLACLVLLLALSLVKKKGTGERRGLVFWVPVVTVLGPLGFLIWLIVGRGRQMGTWRAALVEATGGVTPTVVAYGVYLALVVLVPTALSSELVQLVLLFGLPLIIGWLAFQGPLLALASKRSYLSTLGQRLPQVLVAATLGMAGIHVVTSLLVKNSTQICCSIGALWAIVVLGALVGGVLLFVHEIWAVKRGFQAWSVLARGEGQVLTPSWRELGWWIPLSFALLLGSLVLSVILQQ